MDDLLDAKESLLYTTDDNMGDVKKTPVMPVQGGFLLVRPDLEVFEDLVQVRVIADSPVDSPVVVAVVVVVIVVVVVVVVLVFCCCCPCGCCYC